jgi:hypothetical protein
MMSSIPVNAIAPLTAASSATAVLKAAVDPLIKMFMPAAARNNSLIVNDIPEKIMSGMHESVICSVIKGLLHAVVNNAKDSCIRVSARLNYGRTVEVFVKDQNSYHTYAIACCLQDIVPLAETIGGDINIINQKEKITTVSFTFPNETMA